MPIINNNWTLPFNSQAEAWQRIRELEQENRHILQLMHALAQEYKDILTDRDIYLSIQQVKSGTVYVRWRRKGVNGKQAYLQISSAEGKVFLEQQSDRLQRLYRKFNQQTLQLNLAYSLRLNEAKRIERYLQDVEASREDAMLVGAQ